MIAAAGRLARRTMKARRSSVCPACRSPVTVGQRIGLVDVGWCHIACILRTQTIEQEGRSHG